MCLGVPSRIISIEGQNATVDVAGTKRLVSLRLIEGVKAGDYVIVHAGFAIERINEENAVETLRLVDYIAGETK